MIKYEKFPGKIIASGAIVALMGVAGANLLCRDVASLEGYVPTAYLDPVGIPTICFGDIADVSATDVKNARRESPEQCLKRLNRQLYKHAKPVYNCVADLKNQPDLVQVAFVSMAYNIGPSGFCKSSVAKKANSGDWSGACKRISQIYRKAGGRELPGLIKRRQHESDLCLAGLRGERP